MTDPCKVFQLEGLFAHQDRVVGQRRGCRRSCAQFHIFAAHNAEGLDGCPRVLLHDRALIDAQPDLYLVAVLGSNAHFLYLSDLGAGIPHRRVLFDAVAVVEQHPDLPLFAEDALQVADREHHYRQHHETKEQKGPCPYLGTAVFHVYLFYPTKRSSRKSLLDAWNEIGPSGLPVMNCWTSGSALSRISCGVPSARTFPR